MKSTQNLLSHLQIEYEDRERRLAGLDLYSWFNTANLFTLQQRQRTILQTLRRWGINNLYDLRILEVGCGRGGVLSEFLCMGAWPENVFGLDLLIDRLATAKNRLPGIQFHQADGSQLPFSEHSFDLVMQYTAISSVLDTELRKKICSEMMRVSKQNSLILSYDFWLNPTNRQTRGIRPAEIRQMFPGCSCEFHRITLAPPIARRLATVSWGLCMFLESLKVFNTHYLAVIQQK
jgi:ubiquinone/menaquinone biosynthesis C-methylase UbiE